MELKLRESTIDSTYAAQKKESKETSLLSKANRYI